MKKNKIVALCLSFGLLFAAVGGTIAWLTDHEQVENVFTVGKVDITLTEDNKINGNEVEGENGRYTFSTVMPGDTITKTPTIKNDGNTTAYVRAVVTINNTVKINKAIDQYFESNEQNKTEQEIQKIKDEVFVGWGLNHYHEGNDDNGRRMTMNQRTDDALHIDSAFLMTGGNYQYNRQNKFMNSSELNDPQNDGNVDKNGVSADTCYYYDALEKDSRVYVFYLELEANEEYALFTGLNIPEYFDTDNLAMFDGLEINVYADAIQAQGFEDTNDAGGNTIEAWKNAFDALNEQHPLGWWKSNN